MHKKKTGSFQGVGGIHFYEILKQHGIQNKRQQIQQLHFLGGGPSESSFPLFAAPDFATIRGEAFLDKGSSVVR